MESIQCWRTPLRGISGRAELTFSRHYEDMQNIWKYHICRFYHLIWWYGNTVIYKSITLYTGIVLFFILFIDFELFLSRAVIR